MISLETNILIKTLICKHVLIEHKSATLFLPQFIRKYQPWMLKKDKQVREKILLQAIFIQDNRRPTSNRSLSASISTASCSSPKELTHAVPPQEAVLTLKEMVLKASPMHVSNLINPLSGVALVRNSSYNHKLLFIFKQAISQIPCSHYYTNALTRLSPISHLVLRGTLFGLDATFTDDLGTCLNDSPNNELAFRLYNSIWSRTHYHQTLATHFKYLEKQRDGFRLYIPWWRKET